jgi:hypothetical protein
MEILKNFNTREAASYLKEHYSIPVTPGTMEVWRSYGRGPRYRKVARWVVYAQADLDHFAKGQIVETTDSVNHINKGDKKNTGGR